MSSLGSLDDSGGHSGFSLWNILTFCVCARRRKKRAGSEASLVQNGHFSSVSASKRTLTSQDNILESAAKSSLPATDSCGSLTEANDSVYSAGDFSNVEPRAAPSYLKLSRAIGGYAPYNTYTSAAEHARLRTDDHRLQSSDKQYRGDSEVILHNGEPVVTIRQQPRETPVYGSTEQHSQSVLLDRCGDASVIGQVPYANNFCSSSFVDDRGSRQSVSPVAFSSLRSSAVRCGAVPSVSILPPSDLEGSETRVTALDDGTQNLCDVPAESSFLSICNDLTESGASPKSGHYFLILVDNAERWLKLQCDRTEVDLQATTSDEVEGKMRTAIGKANLLIHKKFPQFRQLCHANLGQKEDDPFKTTEQDLSGFWDMVLIQVEDVNKHFEKIEQLRQNGWNEITASPEICPESTTPSSKPSGTKARMQKSSSATSVRSPALSSSAAAKAREEARKRLMAAKAVGRQRKASATDKDIDIFVS